MQQTKLWWRSIAASDIEQDGAFLLDPGPRRMPTAQALVVVAVDGHATIIQELKTATQPPEPLVVEETDTSVWHGRLVDPTGRPIPSLWLRFTSSWKAATSDLLKMMSADGELGSSSFDVHDFARVQTDAEGRFVLRGTLPLRTRLLDGEFGFLAGFVSESPQWRVRLDQAQEGAYARRGLTREDEFVLVADPAVVATIRVTDEVTRKPVWFEGHAHVGPTQTLLLPRGLGEIELCWARWWPAHEPADVLLAIEAQGYVPRFAPLRFEANARTAEAGIALPPMTEDESRLLRFEIVDHQGNPFDADWDVSVVDPTDPERELMRLRDLVQVDAGLYEVEAPPGAWSLMLTAQSSLRLLRWYGKAEVAKTGATTVRCKMPPHGTLVARFPPRGGSAGQWAPRISVRDAAGHSGVLGITGSTQTELRLPTMPEGAYTVFLMGGPTGLTHLAERSAEVRPGGVSIVDFTD